MKAAGATWCGMDSRVCMVWGGEAFGLCSLWGFRLRFCKLTTCVSRVCVCVSVCAARFEVHDGLRKLN